MFVSFCAMSLQVWDCRFVYDRLCFLGVYWCVCSLICLSVCGCGTTDIKLLNFVVQVLVYGVGLFVCVYVSMTYLSVGMGPQA